MKSITSVGFNMASDVCFYNFNISVLTQSHHILIGLKGKTAIFVGNEVESLVFLLSCKQE